MKAETIVQKSLLVLFLGKFFGNAVYMKHPRAVTSYRTMTSLETVKTRPTALSDLAPYVRYQSRSCVRVFSVLRMDHYAIVMWSAVVLL